MSMRDPTHERLRRLFDRALDLPSAKRAAFLDETCASDGALKRRLEAMLAAAEDDRFLAGAPDAIRDPDAIRNTRAIDSSAAPGESPGARIGPYKLLQLIGEGGFGSVFMAEQEKPVARKVALKIIKLGMDTRQVVARFEQERQALALMEHPNIARVLDAGATDAGRPYFVMDLVKGDPIAEYCDKHNLTIDERLALFVQVCNAVQHAHSKGVIHRDIKPSNVLVATQDGRPHAKVIDFGIAKATSAKLTDKTLFTEHRMVIGTLQYMSPEQAEGSLDIDTRTDVYALGVMLYELLTGSTPFDAKTLRDAAFGEVQRMIREDEPPRPSTRLGDSRDTLAELAKRRRTEAKRLGALIRGDLDWIAMKALEKDRVRRYETADGLALDVLRYMQGEAVLAAPPSASYRLRKFVRRNQATVVAATAVATALTIGFIAFAWQSKVAGEQRDRALQAESETRERADELQKVSDFQVQMLAEVDAAKAGALLAKHVATKFGEALSKLALTDAERAARTASFTEDWSNINATDAALELIDRTILAPAAAALDRQFADQPLIDARLRQTLADRYRELGLLDEALALQRRALETRKKLLGDDHPDTLASVDALGRLFSMRGSPSEAKPYLTDALERRRRVLGEDHPDTLVSLDRMGWFLQTIGKLADAETCLRDVVARRRRVLGDSNVDTLDALDNLGVVLQTESKLTEAEECYREAVEKLRRTVGGEHKFTVDAIGNLGSLLQREGRKSEAEPLLREAYETRRRTLGDEHPATLNSEVSLGVVLQSSGTLDEAERLQRDSVEKLRRVVGAEHPLTLVAITNLGTTLVAADKCAEAIDVLGRAESAARKVFVGDVAWRTGWLLARLGQARAQLGAFGKAENDLLEAHTIFVDTRGDANDNTRTVVEIIVDFYERWNSVEPGKGYDFSAKEWKAKLASLDSPATAPTK